VDEQDAKDQDRAPDACAAQLPDVEVTRREDAPGRDQEANADEKADADGRQAALSQCREQQPDD
jgi:hypothetical protein